MPDKTKLENSRYTIRKTYLRSDDSVKCFVCKDCGSVVGDAKIHDKWHKNYDDAINTLSLKIDILRNKIGR